jgi:exonuclease III
VRNLNTPLSPIDSSSRWKLTREMMKLTEVIIQMDLIDIDRIFRPNAKEYTFFSTPHRTFSKIDHIICHKANLSRYKKIKLTPCILPDHHGLKLDLNSNRNNRKPTYSWKLSNSLLNNHLIREGN